MKIDWAKHGVEIRPWQRVKTLADLCKGGSSGFGWSHNSQMPTCPEKYRLAEVKSLEFTPYDQTMKLNALSFGILWHWLLEGHHNKKNPLPVLQRMQGIPREDLDHITTMFLLYKRKYTKHPFKILATECRIQVPVDGVLLMQNGKLTKKTQPYSVRYDGIIQYESGAIYSFEHKTARNVTGTTSAEWFTNSSIHGQVDTWNRHPISKVLGPMAGVLMDITTKEKETEFQRIPLYISELQRAMHWRNLKWWLGLRNQLLTTLGPDAVWPQSNTSCFGRYGPCAFLAHCHRGVETRLRVKPKPMEAA